MRNLVLILFLILAMTCNSQVMQVRTPYDTTANITIVAVHDKSEADMIVMIVDKKSQCGHDVYWKLTSKNKRRYDYTIRFVTRNDKHDLKIYFTINSDEPRVMSEYLKSGLEQYKPK